MSTIVKCGMIVLSNITFNTPIQQIKRTDFNLEIGVWKLGILITMPIKKASWKSLRQSRVRALRNKARKIILKSGLKTAAKAIKSKSAEAGETVKKAIQALDRSAKKKLIKKNTASRLKSRLMKKLNLSAK